MFNFAKLRIDAHEESAGAVSDRGKRDKSESLRLRIRRRGLWNINDANFPDGDADEDV